MLKKEICSMCKFYAVSAIHAGSGASTSAVDLPIQRERHTNWPIIQASAVKGAFRAHFRNFYNGKDGNVTSIINLIFGSDTQDGWKKEKENLPGAVSISDARLLAFPVRSNIAPFVWVTCPAVIKRFQTDLDYIGFKDKIIIDNGEVDNDKAILIGEDNLSTKQVVLEDAVVTVLEPKADNFLKEKFPELTRLLVISDEMFGYAVTCWTEIQTQIKIDSKTGTAEDGSLRYQEFLPADSLLYSIFYYSSRNLGEIDEKEQNDQLKKAIENMKANNIRILLEESVQGFIQIGGDETLGKGICKVDWINGGAE